MRIFVAIAFCVFIKDVAVAKQTNASRNNGNGNNSSPNSAAAAGDVIQTKLKDGLTNFTLAMHKALSSLKSPRENVVFSPINIVAPLATLLIGARGTTREEILSLFRLSKKQEDKIVHLTLGRWIDSLQNENGNATGGVSITLANGMFFMQGLQVVKKFYDTAQGVYKCELYKVDFNSGTMAVDSINHWVSGKTNGKVKDLLKLPLPAQPKLILASALYFNGEWEYPFTNTTSWAPFEGETGRVLVRMMNGYGSVLWHYDTSGKYTVLGLPYKGRKHVMYIVLPDKGVSVNSVASSLTLRTLRDIPKKAVKIDQLVYSVPYVHLSERVELKDALTKLGLVSVFDAAKVNLRGINTDMSVSDAAFKIDLEVSEAGTTGAAATAITIDTRGPIDAVVVNRPYLFYMHDAPTDIITFWAVIKRPVPFQIV